MRYKQFSVENYKSFAAPAEIHFQPGLNVIIGSNNAGKTALIEALSLKAGSVPHRSPATVPVRGAEPREQSSASLSFTIGREELRDTLLAVLRGVPFAVQVRSQTSSQASLDTFNRVLEHEPLIVATKWNFSQNFSNSYLENVPKDDLRRVLIQLRWNAGESFPSLNNSQFLGGSPENELPNLLAAHFRQRIYTFDAERLHIDQCPMGTSTVLASTAENLPAVLALLQANPPRFNRYLSYVRAVFPDITQISITPIRSDTVRILLWAFEPQLERDDLAIPLSDSGTGISQVLAMLYVVVMSEYPRTILIDEPQSFLHPGAVRKLFEIFLVHPQHQYIITTHSPTALLAANPASIHLVTKVDAATRITEIDPSRTADLQALLAGVGARLSDVFGADRVLWVEGATEEAAFNIILAAHRGQADPITGTVILGVLHTGDFEGKRARSTVEIYRRLTASAALLPPATGFIFDREGRTRSEMEDASRESGGRVRFLPRRMFENYLLVPEGLAELIKGIGNDFKPGGVPTEKIQDWLQSTRDNSKYLKTDKQDGIDSGAEWRVRVHGAKVLEDLFQEMSEGRVHYDKVKRSCPDWCGKEKWRILPEG